MQLATTGDIYAKDDFGEENVEEYNKGADAVMALTSGKIDAVIIDNQPAIMQQQFRKAILIYLTQWTEH